MEAVEATAEEATTEVAIKIEIATRILLRVKRRQRRVLVHLPINHSKVKREEEAIADAEAVADSEETTTVTRVATVVPIPSIEIRVLTKVMSNNSKIVHLLRGH